MDDNAHPHRTVEVDSLESENIESMAWLSYSPDLNLTEYVRDTLVLFSFKKKPFFPECLRTEKHLSEEWDTIPPPKVLNLVDSMNNRFKMYTNVRGKPIPY